MFKVIRRTPSSTNVIVNRMEHVASHQWKYSCSRRAPFDFGALSRSRAIVKESVFSVDVGRFKVMHIINRPTVRSTHISHFSLPNADQVPRAMIPRSISACLPSVKTKAPPFTMSRATRSTHTPRSERARPPPSDAQPQESLCSNSAPEVLDDACLQGWRLAQFQHAAHD